MVFGCLVLLPSGNIWLWSNPHYLDIYLFHQTLIQLIHYEAPQNWLYNSCHLKCLVHVSGQNPHHLGPAYLIVQFMHFEVSEIFGACSVDRSWGGRKRRFCLQIEVPAAVVSHVLKIGLNWSKWANLGGKETWRRADSILGISEHHATSQQWRWRGCKCVRNIRTMLKMVKNGHHCGPRWPRPSFRKSLSLRFKHQSYPPNTHCLL